MKLDMMLQLKQPFRFRLKLSPLVHVVRGFFAAFQQRQRRRYLAMSSIKQTAPAIEVPAVPLAEPEPEPIHPSTPEIVPLAETPLISGDIEPEPELVSANDAPDTPIDRNVLPLLADRSQQVVKLLDEAESLGLTTYPQLMDYVKEQTGTSCSKRTISNWKKAKAKQAQPQHENLSSH